MLGSCPLNIEHRPLLARHAVKFALFFIRQLPERGESGAAFPPCSTFHVITMDEFVVINERRRWHFGRLHWLWQAQEKAQDMTYRIISQCLERALLASSSTSASGSRCQRRFFWLVLIVICASFQFFGPAKSSAFEQHIIGSFGRHATS